MRVVLIWEFGFREYHGHSFPNPDFGLQRVSGQRNCLACFQSIARGSASCVSQLVTAAMAGRSSLALTPGAIASASWKSPGKSSPVVAPTPAWARSRGVRRSDPVRSTATSRHATTCWRWSTSPKSRSWRRRRENYPPNSPHRGPASMAIGLHRLHRREKDHRASIKRNGRRPFARVSTDHAGDGRSCPRARQPRYSERRSPPGRRSHRPDACYLWPLHRRQRGRLARKGTEICRYSLTRLPSLINALVAGHPAPNVPDPAYRA
jgi:hypothetical protein